MSFHTIKKSVLGAAAVGALSVGLSLPVSATLIGDTITITSMANVPLDTWSDEMVMVGAGNELQGGGISNHANTNQGQVFAHLFPGDFYDIGASSIRIFYAALGSSGFPYAFQSEFLDLDWQGTPGSLEAVSIAPGAIGLSGSNISMITPNSFTFQATVDLVTGADFTLNLTAVHVPEPTTCGLALAATLFLAIGRRR